ncbi:hypothetical protein DUI87_33927 [Hirundo rustica rustica]|uniref:ribonuclease H n=1 Tax=Hirundo rustica rustica TaxID=333673 RepID=A0A3M0IP13_HIRRU|nr:hypothetical protein DUI87_33927 [Hirundo rustica rustica]
MVMMQATGSSTVQDTSASRGASGRSGQVTPSKVLQTPEIPVASPGTGAAEKLSDAQQSLVPVLHAKGKETKQDEVKPQKQADPEKDEAASKLQTQQSTPVSDKTQISDAQDANPRWERLDHEVVKDLMRAIGDSGLGSPNFKQLLKGTFKIYDLAPFDLKSLASMILTDSQFIIWVAKWRKALELRNKYQGGTNAGFTVAQLAGDPPLDNPAHQARLFPQEVLTDIKNAARKEMVQIPPTGVTENLYSDIKQGPSESFTSFIDRLMQAVDRQINDDGVKPHLLQCLAFANASLECKCIISAMPGQPSMAQVIEACSKVGAPQHIAVVLGDQVEKVIKDAFTTFQQRKCYNVANKGTSKRTVQDLQRSQVHQMFVQGAVFILAVHENIVVTKKIAIELPVKKEGAQEEVLGEMALTNTNEQCKAAILSLPVEPALTLDDMLQGMKNLPSICQWYLSSLLSPVRAAVGEAIILHYMDDVLVCAPNDDLLSHVLDLTINSLVATAFDLQEEKMQRMPPWKYLGLEIGKRTIVSQKLAVKNNIRTLADVQQLCGSLNWLRPWLGLTTEDLGPLFNLLKGGDELSSPRALTQEAWAGLEKVQDSTATRQANRCKSDLPFKFIILGKLLHLHGMIFQWEKVEKSKKDKDCRGPFLIIEWVFLSHHQSKRMTRPQELVAEFIQKARTQIRELAVCDFECIHIPVEVNSGQVTKAMLEHLLHENEALQFALDNYTGQISIHWPAHKLFREQIQFKLSLKSVQTRRALKALTIFTDASGTSRKSVITWKDPQTQQWKKDIVKVEGSPQVAELAAVVRAFEKFPEPFNLVTDSAYVAGVVSRAEQAALSEVSNTAFFNLLSKLVNLISH